MQQECTCIKKSNPHNNFSKILELPMYGVLNFLYEVKGALPVEQYISQDIQENNSTLTRILENFKLRNLAILGDAKKFSPALLIICYKSSIF